MIFLNSASSAAALMFYLPGVCTHTDTEGKQRRARVLNIFKSSEKTQYSMSTLYQPSNWRTDIRAHNKKFCNNSNWMNWYKNSKMLLHFYLYNKKVNYWCVIGRISKSRDSKDPSTLTFRLFVFPKDLKFYCKTIRQALLEFLALSIMQSNLTPKPKQDLFFFRKSFAE